MASKKPEFNAIIINEAQLILVKIFLIALTAVFTCSGCHTPAVQRIQLDSLALPRGSRVLIAEAIPRGLNYELIPPRQPLTLPGLTVVVPSRNLTTAISISRLLPNLFAENGAHLALIITPQVTVERRYEPYPVLRGWYQNTIQEGSSHRTREEPVYDTRYKFACNRTSYRVFQYDARGQLRGVTPIRPEGLEKCPDTAHADIHIDEFDQTVAWLKTNVRVK